MASQTKKQAWFITGATAISGLLGALIDSGMLPPPYSGLAVAVGVFLAAIARGPAPDPVPAIDTEALLTELRKRRRSTTPPAPMPPVVPPGG